MEFCDTLYLNEVLDDFVDDCIQRGLRGIDRITSHHITYYTLTRPPRALKASELAERHVDVYIKHRLTQGRSRTTVNREMQLLGQALKLAQERNLIARIPRMRRFREHNARQGFFEHGEFARLLDFLPHDLTDFVRFAYWSGWHKGEIASWNGEIFKAMQFAYGPKFPKIMPDGSCPSPLSSERSSNADRLHGMIWCR